MKKAIIYARVSSVTDRQSTDRQVSDLNDYAKANGIEIVRTFEEHISGAKRNEERPVLMAAIHYAIDNRIDVVLLSELSRLGRNIYEVQATVKQLVDNGINAYSLKENLSLFNPDGTQSLITPILIAVLGVAAQLERENIAYRLASGRRNAIAKGIRMGRSVGSKMSDDEREKKYAEVIKRMRKGDKLTDILAWARGKGIKVSYATLKSLKRDFC